MLAKKFTNGLLFLSDKSWMCEACQKFPRPENILSLQTPALNKELDKIEFQASKLRPQKNSEVFGIKLNVSVHSAAIDVQLEVRLEEIYLEAILVPNCCRFFMVYVTYLRTGAIIRT